MNTIDFPVHPAPTTVTIMSFLDKMKKAGKSVVDAGAKQMLKVGARRSHATSN